MLTLLVVGLLGAKCEQQSAGVCFEVVSTCRSCFCMPASLLILHYQVIHVQMKRAAAALVLSFCKSRCCLLKGRIFCIPLQLWYAWSKSLDILNYMQ
ncbi:hypothetical protein QQP08_005447 [Theobroma cacao]|nr:hypothetical protein QQP08_005447 [Theobroma cacao]